VRDYPYTHVTLVPLCTPRLSCHHTHRASSSIITVHRLHYHHHHHHLHYVTIVVIISITITVVVVVVTMVRTPTSTAGVSTRRLGGRWGEAAAAGEAAEGVVAGVGGAVVSAALCVWVIRLGSGTGRGAHGGPYECVFESTDASAQ